MWATSWPNRATRRPPSNTTSRPLKKEPALLGTNYYEIQRSFQQVGKMDDLVQLLEESDIRAIGQVFYVARMIRSVIQDKTKRDRGLALFAKAWKGFPGQRDMLLTYIGEEEIWQLPVMYDYLREAVVPAEARKSVPAWLGLADPLRSTLDGRINTTGTRLLEAAERRGKLEEIAGEIERAEARLPGWRGGKALRGLILARRGRIDVARALLDPLADPKLADPPPPIVRQVVGQEGEAIPALRALALAIYEGGVKESNKADYLFFNSPVHRLVVMYRSAGRIGDARRELLNASLTAGSAVANRNGAAYWKIEDRTDIASRLIALGFPADAARIYDETLADTESIELARDWGSDDDTQLNQLKGGLAIALESLDRDGLAATLREQVGATGPPRPHAPDPAPEPRRSDPDQSLPGGHPIAGRGGRQAPR